MRKVSGDVIGCCTKSIQHSIKNYSIILYYIKAVFFKFQGITKETKAIAMTTVMPLVLFQLRVKFPDFILNKDHALPTIQWGELRQNAWKPCGNLSKTLCPTLKSWKWRYLFFTDIWIPEHCHGSNIAGVILFRL